ncbi:MAG TPA: biopolymer transporter ExbD [Lacibacter sp.]|nr:biopolymer transporter ExbD [Lacibacter sp.]HMO88908.1 biopolymer transporter ExbD [Lacibacter sp.]HMP87992.1 biopolymer transporter ExbD [Lacibacter sp.]
MPKLQIQKKSTWVDMTAFVDVAFLILAFFMLATKFKPPELVSIQNPKSVSSENVAEKDVFKITFDKEGRTFISFSTDEDSKERVSNMLEVLKNQKGLTLTNEERATFLRFGISGIGVPFSKLKSLLALSDDEYKAFKQPGIPIDSANNELDGWINALLTGSGGRRPANVMLNGDNAAKYPEFKNILAAFKKNGVFSFKLITSMEPVPAGTPLYKSQGQQIKE